MHDDDPLVANNPSNTPPPGVAPRHAAERTLVTSDGDPIPLSGPPSGPSVRRSDIAASQSSLESLGLEVTDLVAQIRRVGRDLVILGLIATIALLAAVVAGGFALSDRSALQTLQTRQLKSDVQHAQAEDMVQISLCDTLAAMRQTSSVAGRNAYPQGGGPYDTYYASLAKAASIAGCVP